MVFKNHSLAVCFLLLIIGCGCNESVDFRTSPEAANGHVDNCLSHQKNENGECVDIKCDNNQKFENGECVDIKCGNNQKFENGKCVDIKCGNNQKFENGECVDIKCGNNQKFENGECVDIQCGSNQKIENGECVDIQCGNNQKIENGTCVDDIQTYEEIDPCEGKKCEKGSCSEGVCVTAEMKAVMEDSLCDPETFVEFCDNQKTVYCDHGIVSIRTCPDKCVMYHETYHGVEKLQSGCVDTDYDEGICTDLNALETMCDDVTNTIPAILVSACQRTTRNQLRWVSVDGYYCKGQCDSTHQKCNLTENECDPYDKSNYRCDRRYLTTCYLDSNLQATLRRTYCTEACVKVNDIAMCGYACDEAGQRVKRCVNADSMDVKDSGEFICLQADNDQMYSVWDGEYELCDPECDIATGECKP